MSGNILTVVKLPLVLLFSLLSIVAYSTHLRGGQIRVVSVNGLSCRIELRLLTNIESEIKAGEGQMSFGDGTTLTTDTRENTIIDQRMKLGAVIYTFDHTYSAPGNYLLSYLEPNLTGGMLNLANSVENRIYLETRFVLLATGSSPSPSFPTDPIFVCPSGRPYALSTAAIDDNTPNDFYYSYELPKTIMQYPGYTIPENLKINQETGLIEWDTKFNGNYFAGLIWLVVRVNKFAKNGTNLGYVWRAIQITVEDSDSKIALTNSVTAADSKVLVKEGQERKLKMVLSDVATADSLYFKLYFNKTIKNNISITRYDSTAGDKKFKIATVTLKTTPDIVSDFPYPITLSGSSKYRVDFTFLYMTKEPPKPEPEPEVITGLPQQEDLRAYPNPFQSEIYVTGGRAVFINTLGQQVMNVSITAGQPINTSALPVGVYLLQVTSQDGTTRRMKLLRN